MRRVGLDSTQNHYFDAKEKAVVAPAVLFAILESAVYELGNPMYRSGGNQSPKSLGFSYGHRGELE